MDTPATYQIPTLGMHTRVWEYGNPTGELLILVHGFRGDHHGLQGLAEALAAQDPTLRLLVPDLPGFGETPSIPGVQHRLETFGYWLIDFAHAVTVSLCIPESSANFSILGHSFGSLVVSNALSQGLKPKTITLINPISAPALEGPNAAMTKLAVGYYKVSDMLPEKAARVVLGNPIVVRVMSEVMAKTPDKQLRSWIHDQHHAYFSKFSTSKTLLESFQASISHTVTEYVSFFTVPTLLIVGDQDDITPLEAQVALRNRIQYAQLIVCGGVGHLVHYEAVPESTNEILGFLARNVYHGEQDRNPA